MHVSISQKLLREVYNPIMRLFLLLLILIIVFAADSDCLHLLLERDVVCVIIKMMAELPSHSSAQQVSTPAASHKVFGWWPCIAHCESL